MPTKGLVWLAELRHEHGNRVVPLAIGLLAAKLLRRVPDLTVRLFTDPEELLAALQEESPAVLGFSLRLWNERLSRFCAERAKQMSPKTVVAAGGPSVPKTDPEMVALLKGGPYDVLVPHEGEEAICRLVEQVLRPDGLDRLRPPGGCVVLTGAGGLIKGGYFDPVVLPDIPSPYLMGLLDHWLEAGWTPVVQSSRGCPYGCLFCVSGDEHWGKVRAFSLARVSAELDYIASRTSSEYLILTDENLGILKERDVDMAERIATMSRQGWPRRLYFYSAKIVTPHVLQVVETLAPLGEFGMSFQSLDPAVVNRIHRTNLRPEQFQEYVGWARHRGLLSSTEMIFGFPGETREGYEAGIEWLLSTGVDRIYSYNLKLLGGTALATEESRQRYRYRTKWRLSGQNYGVYGGEVVVEPEEVVVGSESFSYEDYQAVRRYGFWLELASGRGYLGELIHWLVGLGLPGEHLVRFLAEEDWRESPHLYALMWQYDDRASGELFDSPEELRRYVATFVKFGYSVPEAKLNYIFCGRVILDPLARAELVAAILEFVDIFGAPYFDMVERYLWGIWQDQIVGFDRSEAVVWEVGTTVPVALLDERRYGEATQLNQRIKVRLTLHPDAERWLAKRQAMGPLSEQEMENLYMEVGRFGLMRRREIVEEQDDGWRKVDWDKVKEDWRDCSVGISCECGNSAFAVDDQCGESRCDHCGRVYRLVTRLEVKDP